MATPKRFNVGDRVFHRGQICQVINYYQPRADFARQYVIKSLTTGNIYRAFLHELLADIPEAQSNVIHVQTSTFVADDPDDALLATCMDYNENKVNENPSERFVTVEEAKVAELESNQHEASTKRMTAWGVKLIKDWLKEKGLSPDLEDLTTETLALNLRQFYAEIVTRKGQKYSKSALIGARSAINRHLNSPPHSRNINIIQDPHFISANNVLLGVIKTMKKEGLDTTKHKEAISKNDLNKLYTHGIFSNDNPKSLFRKIWFEIALHFGRRGREGLRVLKHDSFALKTDDEGRQYYSMSFNEKDKTHSGIDSRETLKTARMYETNDEHCPVKSLTLYLSKRNPNHDAFFQRPLTNFKDKDVWYGAQPLGVNTLFNMMSTISKDAGLSQIYTNHCIRATTATLLAHAGVDSIGIMSVTGHRNQKSLQSYINTPSTGQRHHYSSLLQSSATGNFANQGAVTTTSNAPVCTTTCSNTSNLLYAHQSQIQSDTRTSSLNAGFPMFAGASINVANGGNFILNMNLNK